MKEIMTQQFFSNVWQLGLSRGAGVLYFSLPVLLVLLQSVDKSANNVAQTDFLPRCLERAGIVTDVHTQSHLERLLSGASDRVG